FAVAVSPDGAHIAYEYSDFVTVYDMATSGKRLFTLERETHLAGKGAWTPDGRGLTVVHQGDDATSWQLRVLDPATGAERDPLDRPSLNGFSLVRLAGWDGRTGRPVVIANNSHNDVDRGFNTAPEDILRVGVYELGHDNADARTLVSPRDGV